MNHIMSCLKLNGYPKAFIMSSQRQPILATLTSTPEWKGVAVIPYVQGVSEHLRRILISLNIRVGFKPLITLRQILCRPKDCVPDLQCSGVVYEIVCGHCPKD